MSEVIAKVKGAVDRLRQQMLAVTVTGERRTYEDGYQQGLCTAIDEVRAALDSDEEAGPFDDPNANLLFDILSDQLGADDDAALTVEDRLIDYLDPEEATEFAEDVLEQLVASGVEVDFELEPLVAASIASKGTVTEFCQTVAVCLESDESAPG